MKPEIIDKVALIVIKEGRVLETRSMDRKTGKLKDKFYIPGGKRETKANGQPETDEEALIRESKAELSVDIIPETIKKLEPIYIFEAPAHGDPQGRIVRMTCLTAEWEDGQELKPAAEVYELVWLSAAHRDQVSDVDGLIIDFLHKEGKINSESNIIEGPKREISPEELWAELRQGYRRL